MARVIAAGTFDREFARNRRLIALLEHAGHELELCQVDLWGGNRYEIPKLRKFATLAKAAFVYPRLVLRFARVPRGDVVLVMHPGWFDMLVIGLLARLRGMPVLFDVFISLSDTVVSDRKLASPRSALGRMCRVVDRWSIRSARRVLADTPAHAEFYAELAGIPRDRIGVVWLGAQDDVFQPQPDVRPVPRRVLFHGTFIALQGLPTIIEAAKLLENAAIEVRLVGAGQEQPLVDQLVADLHPANLKLVGRLDLERIPREIAAATLCLGIFGTTEKAGRVVPNKVFECLAVGRPVLTADTPAIRSAFADTEIATVEPGNAEALAREIARLVEDDETREEIASAGYRHYQEAFATEPLSRVLDAELQRIAVAPDAPRRRRR